MAGNDFDAKQSARYSRVLVVTELVLSGAQCNSLKAHPHQAKAKTLNVLFFDHLFSLPLLLDVNGLHTKKHIIFSLLRVYSIK